jgi:tetratricopeptide (TPR) repeat protein
LTRYPTRTQYDEALGSPHEVFQSEILRTSTFEINDEKYVRSGGAFACLGKTIIEGNDWAIRLLLKEQSNLEIRYKEIRSRLLDKCSFLVDVEYLAEEIKIEGSSERFPLIKMEWVKGTLLGIWIQNLCRSEDLLGINALRLALADVQMQMCELKIAHGDISPENIQVLGTTDAPRIVLLDYDSMWMPWIPDLRCDVGITNLQHPNRTNPIGPFADQMAFLLIDIALEFLMVSPSSGLDPVSFDGKFLASVKEFSSGELKLVQEIKKTCPESSLRLLSYIDGPYDVQVSTFSTPSGFTVRDLSEDLEISGRDLLKVCNQLWPGDWSLNRQLTSIQVRTLRNCFADSVLNVEQFSFAMQDLYGVHQTDRSSVAKNKNEVLQFEFKNLLREKLSGYMQAIKIFEEALAGDIDAMVEIGKICHKHDLRAIPFGSAEYWYRLAAARESIGAMFLLSDLLKKENRLTGDDGAEHWLALGLKDNDHVEINNYGVYLYEIEMYEEALSWFTKAVLLEPNEKVYKNNLENTSINLKQRDGLQKSILRQAMSASELTLNYRHKTELGERLIQDGIKAMKDGHYATAQSKFGDAIRVCINKLEAHQNMAICLQKQNKHTDAKIHFEIADVLRKNQSK